MGGVLRDEEKLNQDANPANHVLEFYFDIPYVRSNLVLGLIPVIMTAISLHQKET